MHIKVGCVDSVEQEQVDEGAPKPKILQTSVKRWSLEVPREVGASHDAGDGGEEYAETLHEAGVIRNGRLLVEGVEVVGSRVQAPARVAEGLPLVLVDLLVISFRMGPS